MQTVLICEDEALIALDLEEMIYDAGHRPVGPARSYAEALELADVTRPTVAIIDINLADGVTGAKVAIALAKRGTRIIVLSSVTDVLAPLAGIPHVFVAKPVDPAMIAEILGPGETRAPLPTAQQTVIARAAV